MEMPSPKRVAVGQSSPSITLLNQWTVFGVRGDTST